MVESQLLWQRAYILQAIRMFFTDREYLEVETPIRIPAPAPEAHIEPVPTDGWFLQTSPELCMKRLLAHGFDKIFQICKCFRKAERGHRHLPEFTLLEWYRTGADYFGLMEECEELFVFLFKSLSKQTAALNTSWSLDFARPWERLTVAEAFERHTRISLQKAIEENNFDEILVSDIEPQLGKTKPTFLYDYPASLGALAKLKAEDRTVAERFELYINGLELANGFSELNDPVEQKLRFQQELAHLQATGRIYGHMPEPFLEDLTFMPESAGIALGVDRLIMLFSGKQSIDDTVSFTPEML